jgi:hypothetical protein
MGYAKTGWRAVKKGKNNLYNPNGEEKGEQDGIEFEQFLPSIGEVHVCL